jgi:hypothetical protein
MRRAWLGIVALSLALPSCLSLSGPTSASQVPLPLTVSVTIEYIQPFFCANTTARRCRDGVGFSASWMTAGNGLQMVPDPSNHVWRAVAVDVPVNFPPSGQPYSVRVFDPYLEATPSQGFTVVNLTIGRQPIVDVANPGTPAVQGFLYVDANGFGHSPF